MKFSELAWGGFIFKIGYGHIYNYQAIISDSDFLNLLRVDPSIDEFQRLRDFLVHYGVHYAPRNLAEQHFSLWPKLRPHIEELSREHLDSCNFEDPKIQTEIIAAFNVLLNRAWGSDTVVSKILHFFNVDLFVMVDSPIMMKYKKSGARGYIEFLQDMQREVHEVIEDFKQSGFQGLPHMYLSRLLDYQNVRPITKLIDDFNWVTITKGWPRTPPNWLFDLLYQR